MQKSCQDQAASQLTKNQIKKRRQKRSKLGKRDLSTASDTSQASTVSVINKSARGQSAAHSTCSNSSRQPQAHSTSFSGQQSSAAEHCVSVVQREDRGPDEEAELASAQHSSAAVALTEARQPGNTPQPASSSAPSWLGSRDCSSQAACIAATLLSRAPAAADPSEDTSKGGSKRSRMVFEHGNYRGYYGYRLGDEDDPRLQVLLKQWFCNKRCLDIGCNAGAVAIGVARRFHTQTMLGVDIDSSLIQHACKQLSRARTELHQQLRDRSQRLSNRERSSASAAASALRSTWFQQEDVVAAQHEPQSLDAILCLSVTKWVHLHGGDAALQALFGEISRMLVPGGIFVLEPQPWRSYKEATKKLEGSSAAIHPLSSLQLRPEAFTQLLESSHGLQLLRELAPQHQHQGFSRPLLVFKRMVPQAVHPIGELAPPR